MTARRLAPHDSPRRPALLALATTLAAALALLAPGPPAHAQGMGPRTIGNTGLRLDAGAIGDQLSISVSDSTTHKMELTRELQYLEPEKWQAAAVTWLRFEAGEDGGIVVTEGGAGVVSVLEAPKKWQVEEIEGGGWRLTSDKGGGKLDLYLDTTFQGEPFKVGAVVPKFEGEAYGAVYRGIDFLFFVVQKKHPAPAAG